MPIHAFDLWEELIGTVNSHFGGQIKPNRNFIKWLNTISLDIFKDMCEEYQRSQVMSDELTIFLKTKNVSVPNVRSQMWDIIELPDDYKFFATARIYQRNGVSCGCKGLETIDGATGKGGECKNVIDEDELELLKAAADANLKEYGIKKVETGRWEAACNHVNLKPSLGRAICTQYNKGFKLAPKNLSIIIMDYFRMPKTCTFEYTIINPGAEDEYIQYDSLRSQPLEWSVTMVPEFIARLQKKYGRFVREGVIEQAGKDDSKI